MANTYTVTLQDIIKETSLQAEYLPKKPEEILISSNDLNRPGLQLASYYDYFTATVSKSSEGPRWAT